LHLTVLYYILCVATIGDAGAEQVTMMMGLAATFLSDWEIHPWHPAADKCICADTRLINPCRYIGNLAGTIAVLGQLVFQITRDHHLWVALKFGTRCFSDGALALVALCLSSFDQEKSS
jgi:hypothetical protein